jgi:hypothetical protein
LSRFFSPRQGGLATNALEFRGLTHRDDVELSLSKWVLWMYEKEEIVHLTKRYAHMAGRAVWADLSIAAMRDDGGRPQSFIT